jgi:monoterpene epsilon-lactone hydrolase
MLSPQSQQIRLWLIQNMKNAPLPTSMEVAREALKALRKPLPAGTVIETVTAGGVPSEWVSAPNAASDKIFICLHGGGYTMLSSKAFHPLASLLSSASGCRGLVIDYRLAPEHPFPAAVDDVTAAYRWLLEQGNPARNIVIVGFSCGGGLALATMITLREAGVPLPAGAVLLSPWTDLAGTGESMKTRSEADPMITPEMNRFHAALYANGTDLHHPLISPLYADLHGLPPMLIHVGSDEIMLDDSTRLAERAKVAGVEVTLDIWEGMWHNWHAFAPQLPEGLQAIEQVGQFIRQKLTH